MFIPVAMGLLDSSGNDMSLSSVYHDGKLESIACNGQPVYTTVLKITKLGGGGQLLARKLMLSLVADFHQNKPLTLNPKFVQGIKSILSDSTLDKEFVSKAITLPGEGEIMDMMAPR